MLERIYYNDSYQCEFTARILQATDEGRRIYVDRTAFYPSSGGQPHDLGTMGGIAVIDVIDEGERVAHVLASPLAGAAAEAACHPAEAACYPAEAACYVDWPRRYGHMQQHTGQHLLSAVLEALYGWKTLSFHMGAETSTIDINSLSVGAEQLAAAEDRCAAIVAEARPVAVTYEDRAEGLRKASEREGTLRVVTIDGIDRSACGGTHVRSTAEIGLVLTGKTEKVRQSTRIEFVCGARALQRARSDRQRLTEISRALGSAIEKTPSLVSSLAERAKALEKERTKLAVELARREGEALYASGERFVTQQGPIDDAMRTRARAFTAGSKAVFLATCDEPPSFLIAVSADSGFHAGELVKSHGGRGGGNATMAQASAPGNASRDAMVTAIVGKIRSATL